MTAPIVYPYTSEPLPTNVLGSRSADAGRIVRQGRSTLPQAQLWERVAETRSNAPAPLTARQDEGIVIAYEAMRIARGPLARDPHGPAPRNGVMSGIIRAGERVK